MPRIQKTIHFAYELTCLTDVVNLDIAVERAFLEAQIAAFGPVSARSTCCSSSTSWSELG